MRKRAGITVATMILLALGALALGVGRMQAASAHVQTPVVYTLARSVQAQAHNQQAGLAHKTHATGATVNGTENDPPDPEETTEAPEDQDQNLPGGGHQDQGQVDHQFEGTE